MTRLAWLTDVHFNFCKEEQVEALGREVRDVSDCCVISGDIAESACLVKWLTLFQASTEKPVYFVLGNHDLYGSYAFYTRALVRGKPNLHHLDALAPVKLDDSGLVGVDGWYDLRAGNPATPVVLNDKFHVKDFLDEPADGWYSATPKPHEKAVALCREWADTAARNAAIMLTSTAMMTNHVILATHVPPFPEAAGSDYDYLPYYCNTRMGEELLACYMKLKESQPRLTLTVLCGHSHRGRVYWPTEGFTVLTGEAEYGMPKIQQVFEV